MTKRKYRHTPAEWKTLREDRRATFLDQLSDHLPPHRQRLKQSRPSWLPSMPNCADGGCHRAPEGMT